MVAQKETKIAFALDSQFYTLILLVILLLAVGLLLYGVGRLWIELYKRDVRPAATIGGAVQGQILSAPPIPKRKLMKTGLIPPPPPPVLWLDPSAQAAE
jgi:hypothetical protein